MKKILCFVLASITFCVGYYDAFAQESEYDVFLLIGQSNMAGRGEMIEGDDEIIEGVYLLNADNEVEPARNPLNRYSSAIEIQKDKMGLGSSFARKVYERTGRKVLLVVNARGATDIEQWDGIIGNEEVTPDGKMAKDGSDADAKQWYRSQDYFEQTIARTKAALAHGGTLKAILWHQGCNDAVEANTTYMATLQALVDNYRKELGDVLFLAGQIEQWRGWQTSTNFNNMLETISDNIPNSDWISSEGLTNVASEAHKNNGKGGPHFDRRSMIVLGERYADKVLDKVYGL